MSNHNNASIDALVKDIHDAIAELAGVQRYPDLTEAIDKLAAMASATTAARARAAKRYDIVADPDGIRALVADAIGGALALGAQAESHPPKGHWLEPFWQLGRSDDQWRGTVWAIARALNCLPSTFADSNGHVLKKAQELMASASSASAPEGAAHAAPPSAPVVPSQVFLCRAWGESDHPCAELAVDWDGVRDFMVREWLGDKDSTDYDGTVTLDRLKEDFDEHEKDERGGPYEITFEIGGVSIERVTGLAASPSAPVQARPTDDELWEKTLKERDGYHEWADELAARIATITGVDIGEHSSANCPWANAINAADSLFAGPEADLAPMIDRAWERFERAMEQTSPAETQSVPEGWKLVPVKLSDDMHQAAIAAICYGRHGGFTRTYGPIDAWAAMLAAAPIPKGEANG